MLFKGLTPFLSFSALLCALLVSTETLAEGTKEKRKDLFDKKDKEMMEYLTSPQFLLDKNTVEIVNKSRQRIKIALKVYTEKDRRQRKQFFKGDIWHKEEQRENYFALQRWLQEVSPITKSKEKK